jgi:hypothetical protein
MSLVLKPQSLLWILFLGTGHGWANDEATTDRFDPVDLGGVLTASLSQWDKLAFTAKQVMGPSADEGLPLGIVFHSKKLNDSQSYIVCPMTIRIRALPWVTKMTLELSSVISLNITWPKIWSIGAITLQVSK